MSVGIAAHDRRADWPHEEPDRKDRRGGQELRGLVALGKEARRKVERECGVDVPVEVFDEVARGAADDIQEAATCRRGHPAPSSSSLSRR